MIDHTQVGRDLRHPIDTSPRLVVASNVDPSTVIEAALRAAVPLQVVHLAELGCPVAELEHRYQATMLLVRPDQHVAWRTNSAAIELDVADRVIKTATGRER